MRKLILLIVLGIILSSCSPTDKQIQNAIEMTEAARPTDTSTPNPTSTETTTPTITPIPTITTSPTPDVLHIEGLLHSDLLLKFLENGFICGEWEINDNGNYEQSCSSTTISSIPDSIIMVKISGKSENTVSLYYTMFTLFKTFDSWDELEELLKTLVDFGQKPEENLTWISEVFPRIKNGEIVGEVREYFNTEIGLVAGHNVVTILVGSKR